MKRILEHNYLKFIIKSESDGMVKIFMVRTDKVSEFVNNKLDFWSESVNVTIKGRFTTHKESRKWFQLNNNKDVKD